MLMFTIEVVGLGLVGGNMAQILLENGDVVVGSDLSDEMVAALEEAGSEG